MRRFQNPEDPLHRGFEPYILERWEDSAPSRNQPGVYLLLDLDEQPLYVGQSKYLRKRLTQHFIRQNSDVVADGLLDIYDVLKISVWYAHARSELFPEHEEAFLERMEPLDILEAAVYKQFEPRWNRAKPISWAGPMPTLTLENADACIDMLDSREELDMRRRPLERIEAKAPAPNSRRPKGQDFRILARHPERVWPGMRGS